MLSLTFTCCNAISYQSTHRIYSTTAKKRVDICFGLPWLGRQYQKAERAQCQHFIIDLGGNVPQMSPMMSIALCHGLFSTIFCWDNLLVLPWSNSHHAVNW